MKEQCSGAGGSRITRAAWKQRYRVTMITGNVKSSKGDVRIRDILCGGRCVRALIIIADI